MTVRGLYPARSAWRWFSSERDIITLWGLALVSLIGLHVAADSAVELVHDLTSGSARDPGSLRLLPVRLAGTLLGWGFATFAFCYYRGKEETGKAFLQAGLAIGTALGATGTAASIGIAPEGVHPGMGEGLSYFVLTVVSSLALTASLKKSPPRARLRRISEKKTFKPEQPAPHTVVPDTLRRISEKTFESRRHLVVFLSRVQSGAWPDVIAEPTDNLASDIEALQAKKRKGETLMIGGRAAPFWSWEPLLAAIGAHAGHGAGLETITVIPSSAAKPEESTISLVPWLVTVLARYKAELGPTSVRAWIPGAEAPLGLLWGCSPFNPAGRRGVDFENFDELCQTLDGLLRHFGRAGIAEEDLAIDITGGQKPTTAVAALCTCNSLAVAQYVQTNDPWTPRQYDIVLEWEAPGA